jgi:two-component sensor histidine kinase
LRDLIVNVEVGRLKLLMKTRFRVFPKASIGIYLFVIVLAIALPILAFVAVLLVQLENSERHGLEQDAVQDALSLAGNVDRQLLDMATTLHLLSISPELEKGDLAAFYDRTYRALASQALYVILVDADGQQLLNTRVPFGTPLKKTSNPQSLQHALKSNSIEVSDVFTGAMSGQPVFSIIEPLKQSPAGAALIITQNASDLSRLMSTDELPPNWSAAILDSSGHVVSTSGAISLPSGTLFNQAGVPVLAEPRGFFEDDGVSPRRLFGYAQIPGWSWKAVVWGPIASTHVSFVSTWRSLVYGGIVLLGIALSLVYIVSRQVRTTIKDIADLAERMGRGEIVSPIETSVIEANQVSIALSNASFDRSQTEDQLHFVMYELVHRTKNLLALAQAMTRQLAKRADSVDGFQKAIIGRLEGLARSIEVLTNEQWSGVSFRRLVDIHLANFLQHPDQLEIVGKDFLLTPEAVQNLGLTLHELATNSLKYGALSVPDGKVVFAWTDSDEDDGRMITLTWTETNGPMVQTPDRPGFGTTVIKTHAAAAFAGAVKIDFRPEGLCWTLTAPRKMLERIRESEQEPLSSSQR